MKNFKWSWNESDNGEWNHGMFDTKEEAIQDAYANEEEIKRGLSCTDDAVIFVGQCEQVPLWNNLDADRELEYLDEMYCDDSGCDTYIYDGVTKEDKDWLDEKLSAVIDEFHQRIGLQSNWFRIVNMDSFLMR